MPTIYIDCSATYASFIGTGIQRVVRNIARHAPALAPEHGYSVKLVALREDRFSELSLAEFRPSGSWTKWLRWVAVLSWVDKLRQRLASISSNPKWHDFINAPRYRFGFAWCIIFPLAAPLALIRRARCDTEAHTRPPATAEDHANDILLLPDATWSIASDIWPVAARFKDQGGHIATVVYDLIPLSNPEFFQPAVAATFTDWITRSLTCTDHYICISRNTELALQDFIRRTRGVTGECSGAKTSHFHLGSDLDSSPANGEATRRVRDIVAGHGSIFLTVGSLEPRKNLGIVLDAFDRLWQRNLDATLVLVGHNTWKADTLITRIRNHPRRGSHLFWLRDATDVDLEYLYRQATALVFPSLAEGFGLPIVEAMQRGLPVICSDIPVFREIADGYAEFFDPLDADALSVKVLEYMGDKRPKTVVNSPSWQQSITQLVLVVAANHRARAVLPRDH